MYNFVPVPFDPAVEIDWSPLWSLTRRETRYLPTAFCYYDFPDHKSHRYCLACSNGCAAGNTREEAVLQGFLELVERDSVALWWYNRVRRPGVDVDSFHEPYVQDLRCSLAGQGREMHVLDLTSDLGIPVFVSWSRRLGAGPEQIVLGFGAHLDGRIALLRAITEMVQMMSHLHQNPLDGAATVDVNDAETVHWLRTATTENQPYLNPDAIAAPRTAADFRTVWSDDVADDVAECQRRVESQGLEMLVLDQTRPEIGLPVVKVVVPGLRHFWARFAPGRLYDAPVRLGWLSRPARRRKPESHSHVSVTLLRIAFEHVSLVEDWFTVGFGRRVGHPGAYSADQKILLPEEKHAGNHSAQAEVGARRTQGD